MKRTPSARNYAPLEARNRAGGVHADQRPTSRQKRKRQKLALRRGDYDRL